ncbi:MAG: radical SAM protein [Anaerolineae bacterium]
MAIMIAEISESQWWSRFHQKAAEQRIPFEATIELTYGCNMRCVHCYNPTHEATGELAGEEIYAIIDQLAEQGTFHLVFTGGEIFTRRDVFEIFGYAKRKGFAITLFTNATLISPGRADRIQALEPTNVEVSIFGATAETYERVTGIQGSYKRFVRGVRLLCERKMPLLVKMAVMTLNQHEVQQAKAMVEGWGIRFVYSTEIHPRADQSPEPLNYRLMPQDVVRVNEQLVGYQEWRAEGGGEKQERCGADKGMFSCSCGKDSLTVTPYGEMNLCVALPIPKYDLKTGDVASGWRSLVKLVESARPSEAYDCPSCTLRPYCGQGPMDAWLETGDLSPCLPYFKELASLEKKAYEAASHKQGHEATGCTDDGFPSG